MGIKKNINGATIDVGLDIKSEGVEAKLKEIVGSLDIIQQSAQLDLKFKNIKGISEFINNLAKLDEKLEDVKASSNAAGKELGKSMSDAASKAVGELSTMSARTGEFAKELNSIANEKDTSKVQGRIKKLAKDMNILLQVINPDSVIDVDEIINTDDSKKQIDILSKGLENLTSGWTSFGKAGLHASDELKRGISGSSGEADELANKLLKVKNLLDEINKTDFKSRRRRIDKDDFDKAKPVRGNESANDIVSNSINDYNMSVGILKDSAASIEKKAEAYIRLTNAVHDLGWAIESSPDGNLESIFGQDIATKIEGMLDDYRANYSNLIETIKKDLQAELGVKLDVNPIADPDAGEKVRHAVEESTPDKVEVPVEVDPVINVKPKLKELEDLLAKQSAAKGQKEKSAIREEIVKTVAVLQEAGMKFEDIKKEMSTPAQKRSFTSKLQEEVNSLIESGRELPSIIVELEKLRSEVSAKDTVSDYERLQGILKGYNLKSLKSDWKSVVEEVKKGALDWEQGLKKIIQTELTLNNVVSKTEGAKTEKEKEEIKKLRAALTASESKARRAEKRANELQEELNKSKQQAPTPSHAPTPEKIKKQIRDSYNGTLFHGSKTPMVNETYDPAKGKGTNRNLGVGLYFAPTLELAGKYGKNILQQDVNLDKVFVLTEEFITDIDFLYKAMGKVKPENADWATIKKDLHGAMMVVENAKTFAAKMQEAGYQGMYSKGYGFADPEAEQIVVYDEKYQQNLTTKPYNEVKQVLEQVAQAEGSVAQAAERREQAQREANEEGSRASKPIKTGAVGGGTGTGVGGTTPPSDSITTPAVEAEIKDLERLEGKVREVENTIRTTKTQAFKDEAIEVKAAVDKEIDSLARLIDKLEDVQHAANIELTVSNENPHMLTDPNGNVVTGYRGLKGSYGGLVSGRYHGGTFVTNKKSLAQQYAGENGKIEVVNLSMKNPFEFEGNGRLWNQLKFEGHGENDISRRLIEIREEIKQLLKKSTEARNKNENTKQYSDKIRELEAERKVIYDDKSNPYGMYDTNKMVEYAKSQGYDGVIFKNIIDSVSGSAEDISDIFVVFNEKQIHYLETLKSAADSIEENQNKIQVEKQDALAATAHNGDNVVIPKSTDAFVGNQDIGEDTSIDNKLYSTLELLNSTLSKMIGPDGQSAQGNDPDNGLSGIAANVSNIYDILLKNKGDDESKQSKNDSDDDTKLASTLNTLNETLSRMIGSNDPATQNTDPSKGLSGIADNVAGIYQILNGKKDSDDTKLSESIKSLVEELRKPSESDSELAGAIKSAVEELSNASRAIADDAKLRKESNEKYKVASDRISTKEDRKQILDLVSGTEYSKVDGKEVNYSALSGGIIKIETVMQDLEGKIYDFAATVDSNGVVAIKKLTEQINQSTSATKEKEQALQEETVASKESAQATNKLSDSINDNIVYHAGDLSNINSTLKSFRLGNVEPYRSTSFNGLTGLYTTEDVDGFWANEWSGSPISSIDLSHYKMFDARNNELATKAKAFFEDLNATIYGYIKYFDYDHFDDEDSIKTNTNIKSIEELYKDFKEIFKDVNLDVEAFSKFIENSRSAISKNSGFIEIDSPAIDEGIAKSAQEAALQGVSDDIFNSDSFQTQLLKMIGFEGIDLRGTSYNGTYSGGTVVFDVKPESVKSVNAKWSDVMSEHGYKITEDDLKMEEKRRQLAFDTAKAYSSTTESSKKQAMSFDVLNGVLKSTTKIYDNFSSANIGNVPGNIKDEYSNLLNLVKKLKEENRNLEKSEVDAIEKTCKSIQNKISLYDIESKKYDKKVEYLKNAAGFTDNAQDQQIGSKTGLDIAKEFYTGRGAKGKQLDAISNSMVERALRNVFNHNPSQGRALSINGSKDNANVLDPEFYLKEYQAYDEILKLIGYHLGEIKPLMIDENTQWGFTADAVANSDHVVTNLEEARNILLGITKQSDDENALIGKSDAKQLNDIFDEIATKTKQIHDKVNIDDISLINKEEIEKDKQELDSLISKAEKFIGAAKKAKAIGGLDTKKANKFNSIDSAYKQSIGGSADLDLGEDGLASLNRYTQAYNALLEKKKYFQNISKNDVTEDDIQEWNKLTKELAECRKEYEAFAKEYAKGKVVSISAEDAQDVNKLRESMLKLASDGEKGKVAIKPIYDANKKLTMSFRDANNELKEVIVTYNSVTGTLTKSIGTVKTVKNSWEELSSKVGNKVKEMGAYFATFGSFYEVIAVIRQGITYVREIDSALTELKKVTDETDAAYNKFLQDMSKTAGIIGSTVKDLTTMSAEWARLGYSMSESAKLAESTAILLNVSEFSDATEASEALISTMQAFQYTADESTHVVDILNEVGKLVAPR